MKLTTLKMVTNKQTTQRSVAAIIEDAVPPPIHAVAAPKRQAPRIQRLDVDGVLARSVPKTLAESLPQNHE